MKYKLDQYEKFAIIVAISVATFVSIMIFGCNSTYYKISQKPPLTAKDTAHLLDRSLKTFPPKPAVIKQGKTIIIKDTSQLNKLRNTADSLRNLPPKIITRQDSCGKEANDSYDAGFALGVKVGHYDGLQDCEGNSVRTDTIISRSHEDDMLIYQLQATNKNYEIQASQDKTTIDNQASRISHKTIIELSLIIALLLAIGGNYLQYRNNKIKKLI